MKNINKTVLLLSFLLLLISCSLLSMFSVNEAYRYTWVAMNPWNGVEGVAFTVEHFLHTGKNASMFIAISVLLVIWWRMYTLIRRTFWR